VKNAIKFTPEGGSISVRTSNLEALEDANGCWSLLENQSQQAHSPCSSSSSSSAPASRCSSFEQVQLSPFQSHTHRREGTSKHEQDSKTKTDIASAAARAQKPEGSPHQRVRAMLVVEVSDSGIGIHSQVLPYLFHAFEQGDASITVRFGGLGMGLAISSSLVKLHSGTLSAASEGKGKGACFAVCLPTVYSRETDETEFIPDKSALLGRVENQAVEERELSPIPISQQHESSSLSAASSVTPRASLVDSPNTAQPGSLRASPQHLSSQSPSPPPTTSSPSSVTNSSAISPCKSSKPPPSPKATEADQALQRILLVEDNKSTLLIMCRLLQQRGGYHVTTASTVAGALEVAEKLEGKFDLVLSDIGLPDGTGLQLMKTLKQRWRLKGIALSGYGMMEDVQRSKDAGFETHLTKPVNFTSLITTIRKVLPTTHPNNGAG